MASIARSSMIRHALAAVPPRTKPMAPRSASTLATCAVRMSNPLARHSLKSAFGRTALPGSWRIAAFHATPSKAILPALPQTVKGTLNDPATVPEPSPVHGSYHWTFERLIAGALVPLTMAPFIGGSLNPVMDAIFCSAILVHSHIGFDALIVDYIPRWRVPKTRKLFDWGLKAGTVLVAIGFYEFETNDVGLTAAVARIWKA